MNELALRSLAGLPPFLLYFAVSIALLAAFTYVYVLTTPYHELRLIKQGNTAAAVSLSGAMIGFVLPLAHSVSQSANLPDMLIWAGIAAVVQLAAYFAVRLLVPGIVKDIPEGRVAQGIFLGAVSVVIGVLNSACMTY